MLRDFVTASRYIHDEYRRRHVKPPAPLEQPRRVRRAIGQSLIAIGERLSMPEKRPPLDHAA